MYANLRVEQTGPDGKPLWHEAWKVEGKEDGGIVVHLDSEESRLDEKDAGTVEIASGEPWMITADF